MSICPTCQAPAPPDAAWCVQCGASLTSGAADQNQAAASRFCPQCGAPNEQENKFCTQCGGKMEASPAPAAPAEAPPPPPGPPPGVDDDAGDTRRLEAPPDWDKVRVTHLLPSDHQIHEFMRRLRIGRENGDLCVSGDPFLSSKHAEVRREQGQFVLYDLGSRNGTYVQVREPVELRAGDELMMGRQILRFQQADESVEGAAGGPAMGATRPLGAPQQFGPRLVRIVEGGKVGETFLLGQGKTTIGRDEGEVCLPDDPLLSGVHASVTFEQTASGHYAHVVRDENSRNGVFIRIRDGWPLKKGDKFTAGRQVFRFDAEGGE